jgi:uncharacterized protein (TIGR02466 family)
MSVIGRGQQEPSVMSGAEEQRFADSHPLRLFPTFVWRVELADNVRARVNASVLKVVEELRGSLPPFKRGEGWQSRQNLHRRAPFSELVGCIDAAAAEVVHFLRIGHDAPCITACWVNVLAPTRTHPAHSHPNNFLSGVYYAKMQPGAETVNFHDPRPRTGIIRPPVTELTADNTDQVVVNVRDGTLLLFPAWLVHSVDANRSAEQRISVSFNMMFRTYAEIMSKPMW